MRACEGSTELIELVNSSIHIVAHNHLKKTYVEARKSRGHGSQTFPNTVPLNPFPCRGHSLVLCLSVHIQTHEVELTASPAAPCLGVLEIGRDPPCTDHWHGSE